MEKPTKLEAGQRWGSDGLVWTIARVEGDRVHWEYPQTGNTGTCDIVSFAPHDFLGWLPGFGPSTAPIAPPVEMATYLFCGEPHPVGCLQCGVENYRGEMAAAYVCRSCADVIHPGDLWREWKAGRRDFPRTPVPSPGVAPAEKIREAMIGERRAGKTAAMPPTHTLASTASPGEAPTPAIGQRWRHHDVNGGCDYDLTADTVWFGSAAWGISKIDQSWSGFITKAEVARGWTFVSLSPGAKAAQPPGGQGPVTPSAALPPFILDEVANFGEAEYRLVSAAMSKMKSVRPGLGPWPPEELTGDISAPTEFRHWGLGTPAPYRRKDGEGAFSSVCHTCRLGDACPHSKPVRQPFIPAVDEWDLLPDAGR